MFDVAILDEPEMDETAAIAGAQVTANPVVVELVVVGADAHGHAARARRSRREQLIADRRVQRNRVVVQVDVQVEAVRQLPELRSRPPRMSPGSALPASPRR